MAAAHLLLGMGMLAITADGKTNVDAVAAEALATLAGDRAFLFTELTEDGPRILYGSNQDQRFAVGSSFKLFILGRLASDVNADRRQLNNTALLETRYIGPPHSEMADWPIGSPVTLHTLALKMIWISDNTATDHLLHLLDRKKIEAQMATMGHSDPAVNRPLLSTREMTMLRDKNRGLPGREYQKLDEAGKRAFLGELDRDPPEYDKLDFDTAAYNVAEWYATPLDMARALDWLKRNTEPAQPATPLRAVMSVDTKLQWNRKAWPYMGFKGGSEEQLLAGNWLLKNRNGSWYTFHFFYNNPHGKADPEKLLPSIEKIFAAIEASLPAK